MESVHDLYSCFVWYQVPFDPLLSIMLGPLLMNLVSELVQVKLSYHIPSSSSKITGWAGMEVRMTMSPFERLFPAGKLKDFST